MRLIRSRIATRPSPIAIATKLVPVENPRSPRELLQMRCFKRLYFVCVMDRQLARYLVSPRNGLHNVFDLAEGGTITLDRDYFVNRSPTFRKRLGEWPGRIVLECVAAQNLPREHCLRIYGVDRREGIY